MTAEATVRDYYEALRRGEPLAPYFAADGATAKFGVSESLFGGDDVAEALREQNRTTDDWRVESEHLVVRERDDWAVFADEVDLAWTDREAETRRAFETRWSGALERRGNPALERRESAGQDRDPNSRDGWAFVSMHVSAPHDL